MKPAVAGLICLTFAQPAFAQSVQEQIITQLQEQGYSQFQVEKTWLGRIRIEATDGDRDRELVFNPRTGEILRDRWDILRDEDDGEEGFEEEDDFDFDEDEEFDEEDFDDEDDYEDDYDDDEDDDDEEDEDDEDDDEDDDD